MVGEIFITWQVAPGRNRSLEAPRRPVFAGQQAKTAGSIPGSSTRESWSRPKALASFLLRQHFVNIDGQSSRLGVASGWHQQGRQQLPAGAYVLEPHIVPATSMKPAPVDRSGCQFHATAVTYGSSHWPDIRLLVEAGRRQPPWGRNALGCGKVLIVSHTELEFRLGISTARRVVHALAVRSVSRRARR